MITFLFSKSPIGPVSVTVTDAPFRVDNTGNNLATVGVQQAINYVASNGGGVVNFPSGNQ